MPIGGLNEPNGGRGKPNRRVVDEDDMGPDIDYVGLAARIKKPRRAILTRHEFLILSVLYEANKAMRYVDLTNRIVGLEETATSVNILKQLNDLEEANCLRRMDDKTYVLSFKGREVLRAAAVVIELLDSTLY